MSIFGNIFGTEKGINTAVEQGFGLIDKAFHTDQEKTTERIDMAKSLQDQFSPRAITRRILAVIIYANTFLHVNVYLFYPSLYRYIGLNNAIDVIVKELELAIVVTTFYFGYYGIKAVVKQFKEK